MVSNMDYRLAREKEKKLGISESQIVREEYEMFLLSKLFESTFGKKLVFRGGTALRLAYGSQRFSEDLDFSQIEPIEEYEFKRWCRETAKDNLYLELKEALKKRFTLFALFKIKDPALAGITISIKVEISVRYGKWEKGKDYKLLKVQSEVTPLTLLAQVASPERIEKEKLAISPKRVRDVFDLWFLGQILKKNHEMDFSGFKPGEVKRELNKLLPLGARRLIEPWLQEK